MTSPQAGYTPATGWAIGADDPFVRPDRLPEKTRGQKVSRFGDPCWNLDPLNSHNHGEHRELNWELFPEKLRETGRRAGWALVNLPTPEELLECSGSINRVKWVSSASMVNFVRGWRRLTQWMLDRNISSLADLTTGDLDDYAVDLSRAVGHDRGTVSEQLYSVSLLWGFAPHLPPRDRLIMPPWEAIGTKDDYLPPREAANENSTEPIHPAVMSPLLLWAIRFVDDFSDDILTAWDERQALVARVRSQPNPEATGKLRQLISDHTATGRPLPGSIYLGRRFVARTYLAGLTDASTGQVRSALREHGSSLPIGTETPLDTPVEGRLHERPWLRHINFHDAPVLMRRLSAACMVVILYLSGMRPGEALELRAGCCPEPDAGHRYAIHGNYFKHARDTDDRAAVGGLPRATPWTVIPPVVRAIRVLERMTADTGTDLLFPVKTPWGDRTPRNRKRSGSVITCLGANTRIDSFIAWVNEFADHAGLAAERVPDDPDGAVRVSRFRRTIAWHIARLPGGRIALAIQYGHLRASTVTDGYSGRARHGLRRVLDIETARAMADYLEHLADRIDHGEGISGPAAIRMLNAARQAHIRFEGMFLPPKQTAAFLAFPQFHVYDNPDSFLTCNHDPSKALCHPERQQTRNTRPPAVDRCDPACANIARTDTHIAALNTEISHLTAEIADPSTPIPLRERLTQRVRTLQQIADRHQRTRIVTKEGQTDE